MCKVDLNGNQIYSSYSAYKYQDGAKTLGQHLTSMHLCHTERYTMTK